MANASAEAQETTARMSQTANADVLVHIQPSVVGDMERAAELLRAAFALIGKDATAVLTFATPEGQAAALDLAPLEPHAGWLSVRSYAEAPQVSLLPGGHTAAAYAAALKAASACDAPTCLLLGPDISSLTPQGIASLLHPVMTGEADLAMPLYSLGPFEGLLNIAVLYPLTRSLFGCGARYPLGFDVALSKPLQEKMAAVAGRPGLAAGSLLWPGIECAAAGMKSTQASLGSRRIPHVDGADLASVLANVLGSLFGEAETKAALWQRVRSVQTPGPSGMIALAQDGAAAPDTTGMIESFRLGVANLQEVWGMVLTPNTLLALRKIARDPSAEFRIPDALWARIVYDFVLAYRQRGIARSHLLGAFMPLYLGWVAGWVGEVVALQAPSSAPGGVSAARIERRIDALVAAFESEKPYLLSRWRWPDRFNP